MKRAIYILIWALLAHGVFAQPSADGIRKPEITLNRLSPATAGIIAYGPNGRFLALANEKVIQIYDPRLRESLSPRLSRTLTGHGAQILGLAFSGTNTLVSISLDHTVKTWDFTTGKMLHSAEIQFAKQIQFALAPGNSSLAADSSFGKVRLWNYQTGKVLKTFEPNDSLASALAFTPNGKSLVIGTEKGVLRVMDVATWTVTRAVDLDSPIRSLAASAEHAIVGYSDGTIAILNFGDQTSIPQLRKQSGAINALAFSANGDLFASGSADGTVEVWDSKNLKPLWSLQGHEAPVVAVVFSPDGQRIASMDAKGVLHTWNVIK